MVFDEETETLIHAGKKGMKWGVRTNPDGSYSNLKKAQKNYDKAVDKELKTGKYDSAMAPKFKSFEAMMNKKYADILKPGMYVDRVTAMNFNKELNDGVMKIRYSVVKKNLGERPGDTMQQSDETEALIHAGKKGMKWGVRKAEVSADYSSAKMLKKNPARSLSNDDLKKVISRMNLEKQYKDVNPRGLSAANKFVLAALAVGTTINGVIAFKNSAAGQIIISNVKTSLSKAASIAAKTGK